MNQIVGNIKRGHFKRFPNPPELMLIPLPVMVIAVIITLITNSWWSAILASVSPLAFIILAVIDSFVSRTWIEYEILPDGSKHILYQGKYRDHFEDAT